MKLRYAGWVWCGLAGCLMLVPAARVRAAADSGGRPGVAAIDVRALEEYDFDKSRKGPSQIEEQIRQMPVSAYPQAEAALIKVLQSPKASFAAKQYVCRLLRQVGSAQSVPALSQLLADKQLSHMARFALQHCPAPEAGTALTAAVSKLGGDLRIGVIDSLGQRRERGAVPALAALAGADDTATARAAINALGRIGGSEAAKALAAAKVAPSLEAVRRDARLSCADSLCVEGKAAEAEAIYVAMTDPKCGAWTRIAAWRGLVQIRKDKAVADMLALLKDSDPDIQRAAGKFIVEMPGVEATRAFAGALGSVDAPTQIVLIGALEGRGDKAAAPAIVGALDGGEPAVRLAAARALAVLGDASAVETLANVAAGGGDTGKAAQQSLNRLGGPGVSERLIAVAGSKSQAAVRVAAIQAIIDRGDATAVPALLTTAKGPDADVHKAACRALGVLAGAAEFEPMVAMLIAAPSASQREDLERAAAAILSRVEGVDPSPAIEGLKSPAKETRVSLLALLPRIGGEKALAAVRSHLTAADSDVKRAAIRALADWPDTSPLPDLLRIAADDPQQENRVLALRGYIALLTAPANRSAAETVGLLEKAFEAAGRAEERRLVLAALVGFPCEEAKVLARQAKAEPLLASEADQAVRKIEQLLAVRSLKASASLNSEQAQAALDQDAGTRWDTGRPMKPGDWFVIDLGAERSVRGVTLDASGSANDYPRGYEVFVSFDGGGWGKPIVTGAAETVVTAIDFGKPVRTRFIRIVQTGSSESWFWSIHELKVQFE